MWFSGIYARVEQISPGTISQSASDVMEFRLRGNLGYNWSGNTITNMPRRMFSEIYLLSGGRQFCILHLPCNFACGFFYSLIIWRPPTWGIGPHCDWMSVSAMMAAADVSALKPHPSHHPPHTPPLYSLHPTAPNARCSPIWLSYTTSFIWADTSSARKIFQTQCKRYKKLYEPGHLGE